MNENLRAIQKELNAKKREAEELAKQVRQMKLKPKAERLVTAIISNDDVCKALEHFTNAEVDVIAETFVSNFDQTLAASQEKLETVREKNARRRASRKTKKDEPSESYVSDSVDDTSQFSTGDTVVSPYGNSGGM